MTFIGQLNLTDWKLPPDWCLMSEEEQASFLLRYGQEPDNIIPFRHPQHIDLTTCF